jgi:hypothetical protein
VELAISAKGFERVFDSIAAGRPRDPEATSAEPRELDAATDDAEIVGKSTLTRSKTIYRESNGNENPNPTRLWMSRS